MDNQINSNDYETVSPANMVQSPDLTQTFQFLQLPAEIRLEIYYHLFLHARIELDFEDLHDKNLDKIETLKKVRNKRAALALTSRTILNEAFPILTPLTHVVIIDEYPWRSREDMLAKISNNFMRHVRYLRVPQEHFMRADRSLMPNLSVVTLADSMHADCGGDILAGLACDDCGRLSRELVFSNFLCDSLDWRWRRKQFLHLAHEEKYEVKLVLFNFIGWKNRREWHEFEFDLTTEKLVCARRVIRKCQGSGNSTFDLLAIQRGFCCEDW